MTDLTLALVALLSTETAEPPAGVADSPDESTIARLEEKIAASPDDPEAYAELARELARRERWADASAVATRAAERGPDLAWTAGVRVFDALHSVGRFEDADGLLRLLRSESRSATRKAGWRTLDASSSTDYRKAMATLRMYLYFDPPSDEAEIVYNAVLDRWFKGIGPSGPPPWSSRSAVPSEKPTEVVLPILLTTVEPYYPRSRRARSEEGKVIVVAVVRTDGAIGRVKIDSSTHADFSVSALDAIKRWKYEPARLRGEPVAVYFMIQVDYRLRDRKKGKQETE